MTADEISKALRWTCGSCGRINMTPDTACVACKTPDNYAMYRARPKYRPDPTTVTLSLVRNEWRAQDVKKLCDDIRTQYKEGIVKVDDVLEFIRNWKG